MTYGIGIQVAKSPSELEGIFRGPARSPKRIIVFDELKIPGPPGCFRSASVTSPFRFPISWVRRFLETFFAAESGIVSHAEVEEWLNEQAALQADGEFFQAWLLVFVSATV